MQQTSLSFDCIMDDSILTFNSTSLSPLNGIISVCVCLCARVRVQMYKGTPDRLGFMQIT